MIKREELIKIGQFNKPHALHGEISFTFTDDIFDRTECEYIVCNIDGIFVPFFIEEYRFKSNTTGLIKLIGIDSAEKAKEYTNLDIYFPKSYINDETETISSKYYLLDYKVFTQEKLYLGKIIEIDEATENVLFIIEPDDNDRNILIPAVDEFVVKIDNNKKEIYLNLPEGLL